LGFTYWLRLSKLEDKSEGTYFSYFVKSTSAAAGENYLSVTCAGFTFHPGELEVLGGLRRECLDHLLVIGELQLTRVLKEYVSYFNPARPHQGIAQRIPAPWVLPPGTPKTSRVIAGPVLNGLHHDYRWAAA
jgi:hypothetical protein